MYEPTQIKQKQLAQPVQVQLLALDTMSEYSLGYTACSKALWLKSLEHCTACPRLSWQTDGQAAEEQRNSAINVMVPLHPH